MAKPHIDAKVLELIVAIMHDVEDTNNLGVSFDGKEQGKAAGAPT